MHKNKSLRRRITDWLGMTNPKTVIAELGEHVSSQILLNSNKYLIAMRCIDNVEHPKFKETDGARCVECNAPVKPVIVTQARYSQLPTYEKLRFQKIVTDRPYQFEASCLSCNHTALVLHKGKADYQEVSVCPKCKTGAFVDTWKIQKYL